VSDPHARGVRDSAVELHRRTAWAAAVSWAIAAASVVYLFVVHRGLGPAPGGLPTEVWHPTGFLLDWPWILRLRDEPLLGIAVLTAPAAVLWAALHTRSAPAIARAIAASSMIGVAIMAFYGLAAYGVWSFFHWRGSLVMLASGVLLGACLSAHDLARALRKRSIAQAAALYLPILFVVSGLIRNATGWDSTLAFNISPWPAIPVLALEIGAYTWAGVLVGLAVGVASVAHARTPLWRALGVALGVAIPSAWFRARFEFTEPIVLAAGVAVVAILLALAVREGAGGRQALVERAASFGLGAALVLLPLVSGRAMADGDYAVSKHLLARRITDSLALFSEEYGAYPERLDELVATGLLESVPAPRVGSGFWTLAGLVDEPAFDYQNLGSSYVLEFVSTEWVMCSYNPPWESDFDDEDEAAEVDVPDRAVCMAECDAVCRADCDAEARDCDVICGEACTQECDEQQAMYAADLADDGGEAWSCPDARPELW